MTQARGSTVISPMLIVPDGAATAQWYKHVLQAKERFRVGDGHLVALDADGAPLFVREETTPYRVSPASPGSINTVCIELFADDPDGVVERARRAGATATQMEDHQRSWGTQRQGGFTDPWGHSWLVGDKSPLAVPPQ
jgi:PhnB protein